LAKVEKVNKKSIKLLFGKCQSTKKNQRRLSRPIETRQPRAHLKPGPLMVLARLAGGSSPNTRPKPSSPRASVRRGSDKKRGCGTFFTTAATVAVTVVGFMLAEQRERLSDYSPYFQRRSPLFTDVIGCEKAKERLLGYVALLQHPNLGHRVGLSGVPPLVFYGPDGSGKRTLALAAANEADAGFLELEMDQLIFADFFDGYQTIRGLFNETSGPTVVYVNHADTAMTRSTRRPSAEEQDRIFSTVRASYSAPTASASESATVEDQHKSELLIHSLLREHERCRSPALLILSTGAKLTRPLSAAEKLDQIPFSKPNTGVRAQLFGRKLKSVASMPAETIDMLAMQLAKETHGLNGHDIERIFQRAAVRSLTRQPGHLSPKDVEEAAKDVAEEKHTLSEWERKAVAFHEAGHAVVSWNLKDADQMVAVSIVPDEEGALGYTQYGNRGSVLHTSEQVFAKMCVALAGRYAEEHFVGKLTTGARDDLQKVTALAYYAVSTYGFADSNLSYEALTSFRRIHGDSVADKIDKSAEQLVAKASATARAMVREHSGQIETVAKALLDRDVLQYEDVLQLLGPSTIGQDGHVRVKLPFLGDILK
jgi:RecA/RadA recombinase